MFRDFRIGGEGLLGLLGFGVSFGFGAVRVLTAVKGFSDVGHPKDIKRFHVLGGLRAASWALRNPNPLTSEAISLTGLRVEVLLPQT